MSKHTPGQWHTEKPEHELIKLNGGAGLIRGRYVEGSEWVMEICPDIQIWARSEHGGSFYQPIALLPMAEGDPTDEANARLIAAAPALLEAAKAVMHEYRYLMGDQTPEITALEAAIKQAEGDA